MKRILVFAGSAVDSAVIAAAYLRRLMGPNVLVIPWALNYRAMDPRTAAVLREDGLVAIDLEEAIVDLHMGAPFDVVITLSAEAQQSLPAVKYTHRIHCSFEPPPVAEGHADGERLYQLRNEIKYFSTELAAKMLAGMR